MAVGISLIPQVVIGQEHRLLAGRIAVSDATIAVTATDDSVQEPVEITAEWSIFRALTHWTPEYAREWTHEVDSLLAIRVHPEPREEVVFHGALSSPMFERRATATTELYSLYFEDGINRFVVHPDHTQLLKILVAVRQAAGDAERMQPSIVADNSNRDRGAETPHVVTGTTAASVSTVYMEFQVDKPAVFDRRHSRAPLYPPRLKANGGSVTVTAQFVIDTLGIPEASSFKVLDSPDNAFSEAVRTDLPYLLFSPAKVNGHRVRELVVRIFSFDPNS